MNSHFQRFRTYDENDVLDGIAYSLLSYSMRPHNAKHFRGYIGASVTIWKSLAPFSIMEFSGGGDSGV